ncbi:MAG: oligosaccharide flippase family protein [Beijerinckiaceae bacterium]|nr:oligosaccharide flippase family protein [Beijerinckiaceae bacterium]MDO9440989.1 oligosaccharide flippase family protein [Beijerinckiaceae bacterium]
MKLIRQTAMYLPAQTLGPLCQFAAAVGWTHFLTPANYGVAAYLIAAQELTLILSTYWWSLFTTRFYQRFQRDGSLDAHGQTDLAVVLAGGVIQILASAVILSLMDVFSLSLLVGTAAFFVTRVALTHYSEIARASERIAVYTIAQTASSVVGSLLTFPVLFYISATPEALIWTFVGPQLIALIVVVRMMNVRLRLSHVDRDMLRAGLRYGLPLVLSGLFIWVSLNGIRFVVEWYAGLAAVGLVSVGWGLGIRLASVLSMIGAAAAFPRAVSLFEAGEVDAAFEHVALGGAMLFSLLAPTAAGLVMISPELTRLFIAEPFQEVTMAVLPTAFVAAALRSMRIHFLDQMSLLRERMSIPPFLNGLDAVSSMICCAIGIMLGDVYLAALGCLVGACPPVLFSIYFAFKYGLRVPVSEMLRIMLAVAAMVVALRLLPPLTGLGGLTLTVAIGAVAYIAAMALLFSGELRSRFTVTA